MTRQTLIRFVATECDRLARIQTYMNVVTTVHSHGNPAHLYLKKEKERA